MRQFFDRLQVVVCMRNIRLDVPQLVLAQALKCCRSPMNPVDPQGPQLHSQALGSAFDGSQVVIGQECPDCVHQQAAWQQQQTSFFFFFFGRRTLPFHSWSFEIVGADRKQNMILRRPATGGNLWTLLKTLSGLKRIFRCACIALARLFQLCQSKRLNG